MVSPTATIQIPTLTPKQTNTTTTTTTTTTTNNNNNNNRRQNEGLTVEKGSMTLNFPQFIQRWPL